jgi:hypothetical protein
MSVATSTAIAIGAGVSAAGAIGGAAISSSAAGKAASTQANAADYAANLQHQDAQDALKFQENEFSTEQANQAPFLKAGQGAVSTLYGLTQNGGFPAYTGTFQAPTLAQAEAQPGYQFQQQQGEQALERSAAASGDLLSSGELKAQQQYGQGLAQTDYNNVYSQALSTFGTNYDVFEQNQTNQFNRLAALAGVGQTSVGQLGQEGQAAASNVGNIDLTSGAQIGQDYQNAAAATASGYVGSANAYSGALNSTGSTLSQYALLNSLLNPGTSTAAQNYSYGLTPGYPDTAFSDQGYTG